MDEFIEFHPIGSAAPVRISVIGETLEIAELDMDQWTRCMPENAALLAQIEALTLGEITSGSEIQPSHPTAASTPKGLTRTAMDGERLGRLAWVPGA